MSIFRQHCLFQDPFWLDAVAPGSWREVTIEKNGEIVARLPYIRKKKWGKWVIGSSRLTPYLGPWWKPFESKYTNRIEREKHILFELIDRLPPASVTIIPCHPKVQNLLPFYWRGFDLLVRYTYRIEDLSDQQILWGNLRENTRRAIRKAEKRLVIREDLGLERFFDIIRMTFERQDLGVRLDLDFLKRIDAALSANEQRKCFFAVDSQDRIHGANYLVWDEDCTYYLIGGGNPALRNSEAQSLLMWRSIQFASSVTRTFDFEGSMIESIERFFRGFGAFQTPRYVAVKVQPVLKTALSLREWVTGKRSPI